jgi:hypothetical protein
MNPKVKLFLRRLTLRWLRKLVDLADDRLHAAEVRLRAALANRNPVVDAPHGINGSATTEPLASRGDAQEAAAPVHRRQSESFQQWEARRSGVAPVSKKEARKRRERAGAAAFDLRFAR